MRLTFDLLHADLGYLIPGTIAQMRPYEYCECTPCNFCVKRVPVLYCKIAATGTAVLATINRKRLIKVQNTLQEPLELLEYIILGRNRFDYQSTKYLTGTASVIKVQNT